MDTLTRIREQIASSNFKPLLILVGEREYLELISQSWENARTLLDKVDNIPIKSLHNTSGILILGERGEKQ